MTARLPALLAASALAIALAAAPRPALAVDTNTPAAPASDNKSKPKADKKKKTTKKQKQSELQQFMDGYKVAHAMIHQQHDYDGGIVKLRALGYDNHPDVANLIGYASRKLGRYGDSKLWYEKALAANPNHTLTWSYYGMWHAEQGNLLKAREHLTRIASICGNTACREYVMLKDVIDGNGVY
jgi:tetratricopeptide (TPR) repeat protein